jgi:hypothetical protein
VTRFARAFVCSVVTVMALAGKKTTTLYDQTHV